MNRLTLIGRAIPGHDEFMVYRCSCGKIKTLQRRSVLADRIKSCGCLNDELRIERNTRHGMTKRGDKRPPEYWIWQAIKRRCCRKTSKDYKYYGARGISVCARWLHDFQVFFADMGPRPGKGMSIDRIDNGGNYEPGNCRWSTNADQQANKRPWGSCRGARE